MSPFAFSSTLFLGLCFALLSYLLIRNRSASQQKIVKIQQELESALGFQALMIDANPDCICVRNAASQVIFANDAYRKLLPENVQGRIIGGYAKDLYSEEQANRIVSNDQQAFELGTQEVEEKVVFPDGTERILLTSRVKFTDSSRKDFLLVNSRDITDLKKQEEKIRESESRLALVIEGGDLGFWDWNIHTGKLSFSEKWASMLGYEPQELVSEFSTWEKLVHPNEHKLFLECIELCLDGLRPALDIDMRMRHKDGSWRWVHARGKPCEYNLSGAPVRAAGTIMDVTDQLSQQAEMNFLKNINFQISQVISRDEFLETVLTMICRHMNWPVGHAYVWDSDECNYRSTGCWYTDFSDDAISEFQQFCEDNTFRKDEGALGRISQTTEPGVINDINQDSDYGGREYLRDLKICSSLVLPIFGPDQEKFVLEFFSPKRVEEDCEILRQWDMLGPQLRLAVDKYNNIELGKRYVKEVLDAQKQAMQANKMISDFLSNMSHEIRTPLNGIIGATDLLQKTKVTNDQNKYLNLILNSGETLLALINDVLDLSKIEAGEIEIVPDVLELRPFILSVTQSICPKAETKGLELVVHIADDVPKSVNLDEIRLKQIMLNLLGNAAKFVEEGFIFVKVHCVEKSDEIARLHFLVKDTGIGIPEDKIKSIFNKFEQVDATTTKKYGGTGLGLAIMKKLVGLMDGEFGVYSEVGVGTEFWFELDAPVVTSKEELIQEETKYGRKDLTDYKVIVIDDMQISRDILSEQLALFGIQHCQASDAEEGWDKLMEAQEANQPFNIALIDYKMPGIDGQRLAEQIRAEPRLQDTRLVLTSGLGNTEMAGMFHSDGENSLFDAYLTKPIDPDLIYSTLVQLDEEQHTTEETVSSAEESGARSLSNSRILLVENELVNQMVAMDMLENLGCQVDLAENGVEAVEKWNNEDAYDVVLMDCMMPVMDGFDATKEIRKLEQEADHQIIIAMTANAMAKEKDKCLEVGMDDYLSKPVTEDDLYGKLKEYIA